MKIFCIGYNKSGTTSVYESIIDLGFRGHSNTMVWGEGVMPHIASGNFNKLYDWLELFKDITVFKDVPLSIPNVWKEIYKKYPNAKYVLSERDSSEQWYNSIFNFHRLVFSLSNTPSWGEVSKIKHTYSTDIIIEGDQRKGKKGGFLYDYMKYTYHNSNVVSSLPYDKDKLIHSYDSHNNEIKEFFKDKDNFISVNVSNDNDYLKLCSFFKKTPFYNKFPKYNTTSKIVQGYFAGEKIK